MPIFSNPGRMWAFIMVLFLENEVSNIKLCILIKSWTYWAWATKLDFQLPWAWWEAGWTALPFSSAELFINALLRKSPHSAAEEAAWWNARLSHLSLRGTIRAKPSEIPFWSPSVVVHCTPSPGASSPASGSLSWSWGLRVISSALTPGRPTLAQSRNLKSKRAQHTAWAGFSISHRWSVGSGREAGKTRGILAKHGGGGRLTCASGQAARPSEKGHLETSQLAVRCD